MAPALIASLVFAAAAVAGTDPEAGARERFMAAWAEAGAPSPADDALLEEYALYPYLQAERLRRALAVPGPREEIDRAAGEFLATHADEPVARVMRATWLADLAARGEWRRFLEHYPEGRGDAELRCQALQARLALGRLDGLQADARSAWLTPQSAPDACDPVFDWLRAQGALTPALVEERARLALASGEARLARWLARSLPEEAAAPIRDWATLIERPREAIDAAIHSPAVGVEAAALLDGYTRLARRDPQAARERYRALVRARDLDDAAASPYARALALGLAWSRQREALDWFERVAPADRDDLVWEWWARAALWRGDWRRLKAVVADMPPALRDTNAWRYWAARAAERLGDRARARTLYAAVLPTDNWYAVLSAARLDQPFAPSAEPLVLDAARVATLAERPALLRARELLHTGLAEFAPFEWRAGTADLDDAGRRAAVALAAAWGWHFQAIATAAGERIFNDYALLYPRPFDDEVRAAGRDSGMPQTLIYAVLRQESLYQPYAVSSAGAVGLMQLLPSTARRTATKIGLARPGVEDLKRPAINVALGAATLADLVDRFDGQVPVALAAYNAGPGAARRWFAERPLELDIWVENIPFNETRAYVQRVMWHSVVFEWLADGEAEDASPWLAKVRPVR